MATAQIISWKNFSITTQLKYKANSNVTKQKNTQKYWNLLCFGQMLLGMTGDMESG